MDLVILVLQISVVVALVVLIQKLLSPPDQVKTIIYVIVSIVLIYWVARHFNGIIPNVMP